MKNEKYSVTLPDINVNFTGHDGGHKYIVSTVEYKGRIRRVSVFLANKSNEAKLEKGLSVTVEGILSEDNNDDLLISDALIIDIL